MAPEEVPAGGYTHLNYAFAFIDPSSYKVAPMSDLDTDLYPRFTNLKQNNPGLETWISIGGWSMNDPDQPTASTFSNLAGSTSAQSSFFSSLTSFMETHGFDGVDIDWEYPVAPERSGKPDDYKNYVSFLKNLRSALGGTGHKYGLSITLPSSYWYMQNFDIVNLEPLVDWFNVMTYDLHGTWDSTDKFIGPIVNAHTNLTEIDLTMELFWRNNIKPEKIILGLGFYGRSFTLTDSTCTDPGCGFSGGANPGPCSANAGTLMNSEILDIIAAGAKPTLDKDAAVKQIVWDKNQWVSYDDEETFKMKIDYANGKCLGGTMVWAISTDDSSYGSTSALQAHNGLSKKSLFGGPSPKPVDTLSTCIWGECGKACPANSQAAQRSDGKNKGDVGIYTYCPEGQTRPYCCPKGQDVPNCEWRGTAPFCNGQCDKGQVQVASDGSAGGWECWTGHKVLCCSSTQSDAAIGQCKWEGAAPFCGRHGRVGEHYGCDESDRYEETFDSLGSGGESYCFSGYKSLCCTKPPPFTGCGWTSKEHPWLHPFTCPAGCPEGKQIIATDPSKAGLCDSGSSYYCCDAPLQDTPDDQNDLSFCQTLDDMYTLSNEFDDDGNPADVVELYWYENEIFVVPNNESPDEHTNTKRSAHIMEELQQMRLSRGWDQHNPIDADTTLPQVCSEGYCFYIPDADLVDVQHILDEVQSTWNSTRVLRNPYAEESIRVEDIIERGRSSLVKLPRNKRVRFAAATYNTVAELAGKGRQFWASAAAKTAVNICLNNKAAFQGRQLGRKYVTEHVTELQTPAQFAQSMVDGKYPDQSAVTGVSANYDWTQVFNDQNGYVYMTWAQLGVARPAGLEGDTPIASIYHALGSKGSNGDDANLLVCDAQTNSLKTSAWAIHTNIISDKKWNAASPGQRLAYLNNLDQSLVPYMNSPDAQASLEHAYKVQQQVFKALDQAALVNSNIVGPGTGFASLHKTWYQRFFEEVSENIQLFIEAKYQAEITNWSGGSKAYGAFKAVQRNKIVKNLQGRSSTSSNLAILTGWLT
ncbi:glycoside hydrolase family 18 protein [Myriangium duriaei CBS 260.36]|uniref:chitinase n=1 Tax=Myriangium duriaei CBS 260.36 TaxID=1168546 RepID=A0A9P4MIZ2_9PEZI|nr:glycoside hydrolase family 18 protein [Myriangium duriaei CBS 260.36]